MSFILDALKKSETDRQRSAAPAMFELQVAPPRARFPVWAIVVGVLLGVNLLGLLWFLLRDDVPTPLASTAAPVVTVTATEPATAVVGAAAPALPSITPPAAPLADPESGPLGFNPADYQPAQAPASSAGSLSRPPAVSGLPSRDDLIINGARVPEVSMSLHVYDPVSSRRFAFINGQRVLEGTALPNGVRVEAITPEGVILTWQTRRFLLPL